MIIWALRGLNEEKIYNGKNAIGLSLLEIIKIQKNLRILMKILAGDKILFLLFYKRNLVL